MELAKFEKIRALFCLQNAAITEGKMMSSPAIHYNGKVFAFFSRKKKMVFKFGKDFPIGSLQVNARLFSPFKTKKPLSGWYEVDFEYHDTWEKLTEIALTKMKS